MVIKMRMPNGAIKHYIIDTGLGLGSWGGVKQV